MLNLTNYLMRLVPSSIVKRKYLESGRDHADSLSYTLQGADPVQQREFQIRFTFWEKEYLRRGFKPISCNEFQDFSEGKVDLEALLRRT